MRPRPAGIGAGGAASAPPDLSLDAHFRRVVETWQGRITETELAARLGISRKTLWERRQRIGLPRPRPRGRTRLIPARSGRTRGRVARNRKEPAGERSPAAPAGASGGRSATARAQRSRNALLP